jgi:hypothetical protein
MKLDHLPDHYRKAFELVLERIAEIAPEDREAIEVFVESVEVFRFPGEPGALGEWKRTSFPKTVEELRADPRLAEGITWGNLLLAPEIPAAKLVAVIAHELGHALTTGEDLEDVGGPSDEWRSELAADRKAISWGFKVEIEASRKTSDPIHHAVGEWFEDCGRRWRVTEDLCLEEMGGSEG